MAALAAHAVRRAHRAPACQAFASILIVVVYPLHREFEALLVVAFGHEFEVSAGAFSARRFPDRLIAQPQGGTTGQWGVQ